MSRTVLQRTYQDTTSPIMFYIFVFDVFLFIHTNMYGAPLIIRIWFFIQEKPMYKPVYNQIMSSAEDNKFFFSST